MSATILKLYFITYEDDESNNFDQFVWAMSPEHAFAMWEPEWGFEGDDLKPKIFLVPLQAPPEPALAGWYTDVKVVLNPDS